MQPIPAESDDEGDAIGSGMASYYGREFAGRRTANGERFDPSEYTAAHRTLPFGSRVRVTSASGKSVIVRINDRGRFHGGQVIDLSQAAATRARDHPRRQRQGRARAARLSIPVDDLVTRHC